MGLRCQHRSTPDNCTFCNSHQPFTPEHERGTKEFVIGQNGLSVRELPGERCVWPAGLILANQIAANPPQGSVIDLGCATGIVGLAALKSGCEVTFLDHSPEAIWITQENAPGATYIQAAFTDVQPDKWDNVYGSEILWDEGNIPAALDWIDRHWSGVGECIIAHSGVAVPQSAFAVAGLRMTEASADLTHEGKVYSTRLYEVKRSSEPRPERAKSAIAPQAVALPAAPEIVEDKGPLLTIGMAAYDDFDGVYFTLQALSLYHPRMPLIVIETTPEADDRVKNATLAVGGRYFHRPELKGTAPPRAELFKLAETPWVCCIDSHVLFEAGAVQAMLDYAKAHPDSRDLIQGPMVGDDGRGRLTHWQQNNDSALWGVWDSDPRWHGSEPFDIPMQGLGHFLMRKEAWPGFHPLHRGFGGEEGYIHEKARQRGGRTLCHPAMGWRHRFRSGPAPYSATVDDHTWNLLVGHRELGIEAEEQILLHFGKRLPADKWKQLVGEARAQQPLNSKGLKILGVWYSNNSAPQPLLKNSLQCLADMKHDSCDLRIVSSSWEQIDGNPLPWIPAPDKNGGHGNIVRQVRSLIDQVGPWPWDVICFLEHDVLYPPDYFARVAEAFAKNPDSPVVSNMDCEGLNATGWLKAKERHEPMHQLSMRRDYALTNLDRCEEEGRDKGGYCLLEPQGSRASWVRLSPTGKSPSIHVNHPARFTNHGEVCYEAKSSIGHQHPIWGDAAKYWPGELEKRGPGTELKNLLASLGIMQEPICSCQKMADNMDAWGPQGCEEHFAEIVEWMHANKERYSWAKRIEAAANAVKTGLALRINWLDPFPDIVREAIRLAAVADPP